MKSTARPVWGQIWPGNIEDLTKTRNERMQRVISAVRTVAPTKTTVLLTGETGTGKGLIARLIHQLSNRRDMPFYAVHCGAIPDTLLESELFGHEKGAFTGAVKTKRGKFEMAGGGTLFLDEIGTITPAAQIKLLQVLQDRVFHRVGAEQEIDADVRLVAATNDDLKTLAGEGRFRPDLYYRVNVFNVEIPPLRDRAEDIPTLVDLILRKQNHLFPKEIRSVHPDVMKALQSYSWPGNIRELENLLERAYILETSSALTPDSFPAELLTSTDPFAAVAVDVSRSLAEVRREAVESVERLYLTDLLATSEGRIAEAAAKAQVTPRQLHKLLTKYGIRKELFKKRRIPKSEA